MEYVFTYSQGLMYRTDTYMSLSKLQELVRWTGRLGVLQSMGSQRVGHD